MPALNMPVAATPNVVPGNPSVGKFVVFNPFSGPKGSPFDAKSFNPTTPSQKDADPTNYSTGALNTGIGYGTAPIFNPTAPASIRAAGFEYGYTPGLSLRTTSSTLQTATTAILTCIGGGKSDIVNGTGANGNGTPASEKVSSPVPYVAQPLLGFGNGGSRDAGAGPAFTGFGVKTVTASAGVAVGAAIEAGFLNRSDRALVNTESAFGSNIAASPAVT